MACAWDTSASAPRTAGTGEAGNTGDGGPARLAQLDAPESLAWGPDGSLYVVDRGSHKVRRVAPDGTISTFAGNGFICDARGCGDGGPATEATFE